MSIKIPEHQTDVDKEWLMQAMTSFTDGEIEVVEVRHVTSFTGLRSAATQAEVKINGKPRKLFIKSMANEDNPFRAVIAENKLDEAEVKLYKQNMPALICFAKEKPELGIVDDLESMIPAFFSGGCCLEKEGRGFYLILEDLSDGYSMRNGPEGLKYNGIADVLLKIATFHATAYACNNRHPEVIASWKLESWQETTIKYPGCVEYLNRCFDKLIEDLTREEADLLGPAIKLKEHWEMLYKNKICVDRRFVSHGDLWINNIMMNEANRSKILDWQTICPNHPVLDIGFLLFTSLNPEDIDAWSIDLIGVYFKRFSEICVGFEVETPFDLDELARLVLENGVVMTFVFLLSCFEEVACKKPHFKKRFMWLLRKCLQVSSELS